MPYKDKAKQREAQKHYEEKRKGTRYGAWMLIFYPDSAPPDWEEQLSEIHLPVWVSPLHDRDVWLRRDETADPKHKAGDVKKPHYHLVVQYPNPVTRDEFITDFGFLNGPSSVKRVKSIVSMVRYLIHKDDPNKAQYSREDVKVFGGADIGLLDAIGDSEMDILIADMEDFIDEQSIVSFAAFVRYCRQNEPEWFRLINRKASFTIEKYIKSNRYDLMDMERRHLSTRHDRIRQEEEA